MGHQENDLTAALAFTFVRSRRFLRAVVRRLLPEAEVKDALVGMEIVDAAEHGRTDLEVRTRDHLVVVEAKRGWNLPELVQLKDYAGRVKNHGDGLLVTLV